MTPLEQLVRHRNAVKLCMRDEYEFVWPMCERVLRHVMVRSNCDPLTAATRILRAKVAGLPREQFCMLAVAVDILHDEALEEIET